MPCEKYQDALTDLAARGAEVVGVVREHLNVCASCRSYLEQEQVLFVSIDSGVQAAANAAVPASLLQRFEARIAQEAEAKHITRVNWNYALVAAAVLIVLALPIWRSRNAKDRIASPAIQQESTNAKQLAPGETAKRVGLEGVHMFQPSHRHLSERPTRAVVNVESEVVVPPDERQAFERFLSDLNGRQVLATALVEPLVGRHEQREAPIETPDIETAALTVEPLIVRPLEETNDK
jgi:hypothetical protein